MVVIDGQHEAVQLPEVAGQFGQRFTQAREADTRSQEGTQDQQEEQGGGAQAEGLDETQVGARYHRHQYHQSHTPVTQWVRDTADVVGQVVQEQVACKSAGADDRQVVDELDGGNFKQAQPGLDNAEVEGGQEIKTPDQETPEAELQGQGVGEGVVGLTGKGLEIHHGEHDQADIQPRGKQDRQEGHHRHGNAALDSGIAKPDDQHQ